MAASPGFLSPVDPERPLLVVATPEEAEHLGIDLPVLITGIGRLNTATRLTEALVAGPRPTSLVNVGTAGSLTGVTGVHRIGTVVLHDFSHAAIAALAGAEAYPPITLDPSAATVLATGDAFIEDTATRARLAQHADLVDMEGYAVAWVGQHLGVPVTLIKLVSDTADADAGRLWIDGVAECSRVLGSHLSTAVP